MTFIPKILFISPAAAVYGSERSMLALLVSRSFDAEVVCPGGGALERELQHLGIKVHPQVFGKYSLRQNPLWHFGFYYHLRQFLRACKPDVVVINLDGNTPLVTLAAVLAGIPIIRFSRFEFIPPGRFIDRWCWRKVKAVICPSELVRQQFLSWAGPKFHKRVHRFYDAYTGRDASSDERTAFLQEFDLGNDKIIGYVGRLHRGKRIETAIESLAIVRKHGTNAKLLIIGDDDGSLQAKTYREELDQLAEKLSVGNAVIFTGYLDHKRIPAAFSLMDVFILPSESESFGMVLMEAWAHGVPSVASDVGGCNEITQASGGGFLAPAGNAERFAERALSLLTDTQTAESMGCQGKTWVAKNCNPGVYAVHFDSILNALSREV